MRKKIMFAAIVKRWQRKSLRDALRGRRKLLAEGRHDEVDRLCAILATSPLPIEPSSFSRLIYGASLPQAELATRQFLYLRVGLYRITAPLFALAGRPGSQLAFPLPGAWIKLLRAEGVPINEIASRLLWAAAMLFFWLYGILTVTKLIGATLFTRPSARELGVFAHFESVGLQQTPRPGPDGLSHDVMTWYRHWPGRAPDVQTLTFRTRDQVRPSDPNVVSLSFPMRLVISFGGLLGFAGWSLVAVLFSLLDMIRGRWWHALMLHEAALAHFVIHAEPEALARDYLFNNSGWFQRPLWTYEAEARGSRIIFYHYSTNSALFKQPDGYRPENHSWLLSNWPLQLVWNAHHDGFVQRAVGRPTRTELVGPIWFGSSPEPAPSRPGPSIAVFDVTPFRPSKAPSLALAYNYYSPQTCATFMEDIARASREAHFTLLWKRKRNIGKAAHPAYRAMATRIDEQGLAHVISADHSPIRVIEAVDGVISMPFTSTAHLARHLGKPSCYYDPTGLVQKDDHGAHDIPVLHGYDDLELWIRSLRVEMTATEDS